MALPLLGALAAIALVGGQLQNTIQLYPPLWNAWQKWALSTWPNVNPTIQELIQLRFRQQISEGEYLVRCEEAGINNEWAQRLYTGASNLLSAADYISLWRRGEISEQECNDKLSKLQMSEEVIAQAKKATEFIPSPNDVVRFAVREAYTPEVATKFGAYEDLPSQYISEAAKTGLPEVVAKQFWAAHWELPSATQGYEMYQRGIIDFDTLKLLLRSLDVMPFWRERMIQAAYNPLTRVDVRRMYNMGVLTEEEVYNAYLDTGYSPENAKRLTTFTTMDTTKEVENAPLTALQKAYKNGVINAEGFREGMKNLNYSDVVIEFWFTLTEYERRDSELDEYTQELKAQYVNGIITIDEVRKQLEGVDAPSSYIVHQITLMQRNKTSKAKQPSLTDLRDWLKLHLIDDKQFIERALQLGYQKQDVELYISEIAHSTPVDTVKYLPQTTYAKWFVAGLLTETRYRQVLTALKLTRDDIETAIIEGKRNMLSTEV